MTPSKTSDMILTDDYGKPCFLSIDYLKPLEIIFIARAADQDDQTIIEYRDADEADLELMLDDDGHNALINFVEQAQVTAGEMLLKGASDDLKAKLSPTRAIKLEEQ